MIFSNQVFKNWRVMRIKSSTLEKLIKLLTFGRVDIEAIKRLAYLEGYVAGKKDEMDSWWRQQDLEVQQAENDNVN